MGTGVDQKGINKIRRRAIGLLCACFILFVLVLLEASQLDYYFFPNLTLTSSNIVLIYRRNPDMGGVPSSYLHHSPDGEDWSEAVYLPFDPGSGLLVEDKLYAIRGEHYSVYDMTSVPTEGKTRWERSSSFELDWKVAFGLADGERIRLLGIEDIDDKRVRIREAILSDTSARELTEALETTRPEILSACIHEETLYVLCRESAREQVRIYRRETGGGWEEIGSIPEALAFFDCAGASGALHIVAVPGVPGTTDRLKLVHFIVSEEGEVIDRYEIGYDLRNYFGRLRKVSEISLAARDDRLYLACRFGSVIASSVYGDGKWDEFTTMRKVPMSTTAVMWGWYVAVLALCGALVWTGFQLYLAKRGKLRFKPEPEPVAFETAPFWRRGVAFAIDFAIVGALTVVVAYPEAGPAGGRSMLDLVNLQHPLIIRMIILVYFALPEAVFGITIGKLLLGIAVRREDGRRAGVWPTILRNLFKLVDMLLLIEALTLVMTKNTRRIGDFVSGTVVATR